MEKVYQTIKDWFIIVIVLIIIIIAIIYTVWIFRLLFFPYVSDLFFMLGLCETSDECNQILFKPPFFNFIYDIIDKAVSFIFKLFY